MRRPVVLVVDDEPGMLRAVRRVLEPGHEIIACQRPTDALDCAARTHVDLALLDIRMPEMSGFDLLDALKRLHPGIDAIIMTGSVHELDAQLVRAIRAQAYYFIQKPFDRAVLQTLVERCLTTRRLAADNRRYLRRIERELTVARRFQQSLLPPRETRLGSLAVSAHYEPCSELGGDFFDYAMLSDAPDVALVVADVSGHGVSAAMLTGIVKSAFRASAAGSFSPANVLDRIQASLADFSASRFITAFAARLRPDHEAFTLEFASAGHPPALLWRHDRDPQPLDATGPLVSAALPAEWDQRVVADARRLFVYTDGVADVENEAGQQFGCERVIEAARNAVRNGTDPVVGLRGAVRTFAAGRPLPDDFTLVCAHRAGP